MAEKASRQLPADLGPTQLLSALEAAGFVRVSTAEAYVRLDWPATARGVGRSIVVPLNHASTSYETMMTTALDDLFGTAAAGAAAGLALTVLGASE